MDNMDIDEQTGPQGGRCSCQLYVNELYVGRCSCQPYVNESPIMTYEWGLPNHDLWLSQADDDANSMAHMFARTFI